jgi:hypothetical protein
MLNLVSTSDLISIITGSAVSTIYCHADFADYGTAVTPGNQNTSITTAATTTVVSAPAASTQRAVKSLVIFNSHATSSNKITIQLVNASSTVQLFVYTLNAGETIMYGEDGKFYVIDATGQIKTAPGNVLTSPVINGTPTGTGVQTIYYLKGSGSGTNYSTTSTTPVIVDATNLSQAVTIPIGWKLYVSAKGAIQSATAAVQVEAHILDGTTVLDSSITLSNVVGTNEQFICQAVVAGDGASHTIALYFNTTNASDAAAIANNSDSSTSSFRPKMILQLEPSN